MWFISPHAIVHTVLQKLGANLALQILGVVIFKMIIKYWTEVKFFHHLNKVVRAGVNKMWVHMILLCATITTVAGCCMIMKHDGMDLTFEFDWL